MVLIREHIENAKYITESSESGKKNLYIEGTFLVGNRVNKNNRMYKMDTLRNEVARYTKDLIESNRALGELGHPDTPNINLDRACIKITSLKEDGDTYFGRALVLGTPYGQIVKNFIENDVNLGVSSRALGSVSMTKEGYNLVQDDLRLATAADIVADPSAPGAFVNGIMENKEWMMVGNVFVEADHDQFKKIIRKASKAELENTALKLFETYLRKL
jgi:hypothetical protein